MLEVILFFLIIFISNIIQEMTGFAGTVLAMPFSLTLVGADIAKPVLNIVALMVSLTVCIKYRKEIMLKEFLFMISFVLIGFILGFVIERLPLNEKIILRIYGSLICVIAVLFFFIEFEKVPIPNVVLAIILIFAGVLHKLYISGGPLVVIYARKKFTNQAGFRANLSSMWVILNLLLLGFQSQEGILTNKVALYSLIGCIISIVSIILGIILSKFINKKLFFKITCVLLLISGIRLLF